MPNNQVSHLTRNSGTVAMHLSVEVGVGVAGPVGVVDGEGGLGGAGGAGDPARHPGQLVSHPRVDPRCVRLQWT